MRLTADLINSSFTYLNPLKERELDLRGHKIPLLENLAAPAVTTCDSLDLTDNVIPTLSNFPLLPRLRTLLVARNRISTINPSIVATLPSLTTLVLSENRLTELAELDNLRDLSHLSHLSLVGNDCTKREHYREWVVARLPTVRFLDYERVREAERKRALELFGTIAAPTSRTQDILGAKRSGETNGTHSTFDITGDNAQNTSSVGRVKLTEKESKRVDRLLRGATSLSEISRLEKELRDGRIPGGIAQDDDSDA